MKFPHNLTPPGVSNYIDSTVYHCDRVGFWKGFAKGKWPLSVSHETLPTGVGWKHWPPPQHREHPQKKQVCEERSTTAFNWFIAVGKGLFHSFYFKVKWNRATFGVRAMYWVISKYCTFKKYLGLGLCTMLNFCHLYKKNMLRFFGFFLTFLRCHNFAYSLWYIDIYWHN